MQLQHRVKATKHSKWEQWEDVYFGGFSEARHLLSTERCAAVTMTYRDGSKIQFRLVP